MALLTASRIKLVGILAVEMFVANEEIYMNELEHRSHNSDHYSIEACNFSQFDLHILDVCRWNLPKSKLLNQQVC